MRLLRLFVDSSTTNIREFFTKNKIENISVTDFLSIKDEKKVSNRTKIFQSYTEDERRLYQIDNESLINEDANLSTPLALVVPIQYVKQNLLVKDTNFLKSESADNPLFQEGVSLYSSFPDSLIWSNTIENYNSLSIKANYKWSVWCWCKALSEYDGDSYDKIINLTPFIQSITTSSVETGGTFQLSLSPIVCSFEGSDNDPVTTKRTLKLSKSRINDSVEGNTFYQKASIFKKGKAIITRTEKGIYEGEKSIVSESKTTFKRSRFYLHDIISENDVVFIKLDSVFSEMDNSEYYAFDEFFDKNGIPNKKYDMIGLVDTSNIAYQAASTDVSINIMGRDLMKLLMEDGSYFYSIKYTNPEGGGIFVNKRDELQGDFRDALRASDSRAGLRFAASGRISIMSVPQNRNIRFLMELLIGQLANIQICPDELFEAYGERRTKFKVINNKQNR